MEIGTAPKDLSPRELDQLSDVPFYLRPGKRLPKRQTEIAVQFKRPPFLLFRDTPVEKLQPNLMVLHIAPRRASRSASGQKVPGPQVRLGSVNMDFNYADYFGAMPTTGYEVLLYDCIIGDATLFQSAEMIEAGWSVVDPVLDVWNALPARNFPNYVDGTWGQKRQQSCWSVTGANGAKSNRNVGPRAPKRPPDLRG